MGWRYLCNEVTSCIFEAEILLSFAFFVYDDYSKSRKPAFAILLNMMRSFQATGISHRNETIRK
jgi:hypothetical protein